MPVTFEYSGLAAEFNTVVAEGVHEILGKFERRVLGQIRTQNQRFFTMLASKIIDKAGPPALGSFTPSWEALNEEYVERKVAAGKSPNFYSYSGDLEEELKDLEVEDVFGDPEIRYKKLGTNVEQDLVSIEREGRRFRSRGTGRFMSHREAVEITSYLISIRPFSNLTSDDTHTLAFALPDDIIAFKLANFRGQYLRPALKPFFDWWMKYRVAEIVKREFG